MLAVTLCPMTLDVTNMLPLMPFDFMALAHSVIPKRTDCIAEATSVPAACTWWSAVRYMMLFAAAVRKYGPRKHAQRTAG